MFVGKRWLPLILVLAPHADTPRTECLIVFAAIEGHLMKRSRFSLQAARIRGHSALQRAPKDCAIVSGIIVTHARGGLRLTNSCD